VQVGAEELIRAEGAAPSFPAQTSRNEIAAHYCSSPSDPTIFEVNDLVKVDVGAHVDGYPADTGVSVDLSEDGRWAPMIRAAADALDAAIGTLRDGVRTGEIGAAVEESILSAGFRPISNLTGHGLARWSLHSPPQIPNVLQPGGRQIKAGTVFAIEPFATSGVGLVDDVGTAEVFIQRRAPAPSNKIDRAYLADIESWNGLPFARRYFLGHPRKPFDRCLQEMIRQGAVYAFQPLVEASRAHVAWKEHTIYLSQDGPEVLTI
jgi:methionyl aminopeptidase